MIHKNIKTFKNWLKETKLTYKMKKVSPKNNKLKDIKIVFSGFRDKELEKKIIDYGGIIGNTISKNTDYLIVKDINNESSKIVKAKDLGVKIITIEEFNLI
jgi:NAD-dependent DNA ligase